MLYRSYVKLKASKWTPLVFVILALFTPPLYADSCALNQFHEIVDVAYVYDGDTIKLADGRKVRLVGINTPERGRNGRKDEPFSLAAKSQLQQIINNNHHQIKIVFGKEKHDRYKRFLAHIFTMNNENITATLIKNGMGYSIAIPPNIQLLSCYQDAEHEAQKHKRGIWDHRYSQVINVNSLKTPISGFHRINGIVHRIGESHSSYWLNLKTKSGSTFALRIPKKDLPYFTKFHPKDLLNRRVIARGWVSQSKNEQRMTIHHPASLQIQNTD